MIIMSLMGYRKRTGFITGTTLAQISEFSLIFMAMGLTLGHVTAESLGLLTLTGLVTIALSVYLITYSHTIYNLVEPTLFLFERHDPFREKTAERQQIESKLYDVVIFGIGRYGTAIAEHLRESGLRVLAVDFNPDQVRHSRLQGIDTLYGDASDQDFVTALPMQGIKWVISAVPQHELGLTHEDPRLTLIDALRQAGYTGKIAVATHSPKEVMALQNKGADLIFLPFHDAAYQAVEQIKKHL